MLCLVSAIAVVYSSHSCRRFYGALQDLEIERWRAQAHYSRLLLEQSTLASPHRVLGIAKDQLGMRAPSIGDDSSGGGMSRRRHSTRRTTRLAVLVAQPPTLRSRDLAGWTSCAHTGH